MKSFTALYCVFPNFILVTFSKFESRVYISIVCPTLYAKIDGINSTISLRFKLLFSGARKEGKFKKKVRVAPVQQKLNIKEP